MTHWSLSLRDPQAQDLLWRYADRLGESDPLSASALRAALVEAGFRPPPVCAHMHFCNHLARRFVPALGRAVCLHHAGYWRRRGYEIERLTAAHLTDDALAR